MNWNDVKRMREALQKEEQKKRDAHRTEIYEETAARMLSFNKNEEKKVLPYLFASFGAGGIFGAILMFLVLFLFIPETDSSKNKNDVTLKLDKEENNRVALPEEKKENENSYIVSNPELALPEKQESPKTPALKKNTRRTPKAAANIPPEVLAEMYGDDAVAEISHSNGKKSKNEKRR